MIIQVMKSKIHRVRVTEADLNYIGSITIDENLMDAANLIENEQVHVLNYRNGERIITYVIKGERGSGIICLNGPAALKFSPGDDAIVISYCDMEFEAAKKFSPSVIFPDVNKNNQLNK
jgi:aspartate 1-decarboxylase